MGTETHTLGPWTARRMHTGGYDVVDPRGRDVVTIYGGGVETESREANARLIAAAPDLLEALKAVRALVSEAATTGFQWQEGDWVERLFANQSVLSAAIARATQEPQAEEGGR